MSMARLDKPACSHNVVLQQSERNQMQPNANNIHQSYKVMWKKQVPEDYMLYEWIFRHLKNSFFVDAYLENLFSEGKGGKTQNSDQWFV